MKWDYEGNLIGERVLLDERGYAELINELRYICGRGKDGNIKDWGRLRTIIGNLLEGHINYKPKGYSNESTPSNT